MSGESPKHEIATEFLRTMATKVGGAALRLAREAGRAIAGDFTGSSPDALTHQRMMAGIDGVGQRQFVLGECAVQRTRTEEVFRRANGL